MGVALFQIKLMPESPSTNLEEIKSTAKQDVEELTGKIISLEEQDIAFGLKAIIVGIRINEDIDSSKIEEVLANIDGVSSVQIIDYRRAIN